MTSIASTWDGLFGVAEPAAVVCVGLNYKSHAGEVGQDLPSEPLLFAKTSSSIIGPGDSIVLPSGSTHVDAEAELAVVIGRHARDVSATAALDYVFGYTVANDVSARDIQFNDTQWFRGKSYDTFCPLLPKVVPVSELGDAKGLRVVQRVNGLVLQDGNTDALIFDVPTLVAYVSSVLTLRPGDVILSGTPDGVGYFRDPPIALRPGDAVEIEVEGVGVLSNPVTAAKTSSLLVV